MKKTLKPSPEPLKALDAALAGYGQDSDSGSGGNFEHLEERAVATVRLMHSMESNPEEVFGSHREWDSQGSFSMGAMMPLTETRPGLFMDAVELSDIPAESLVGHLTPGTSMMWPRDVPLIIGLFRRAAATGDPEAFLAMQEKLPEKTKGFGAGVVQRWPADKLDSLVRFATVRKEAGLLGAALLRLPVPELRRQVDSLMSTEEGKELLRVKGGDLAAKVYKDTAIPIAERIAWLEKVVGRDVVLEKVRDLEIYGTLAAMKPEDGMRALKEAAPGMSLLAPEDLESIIVTRMISKDPAKALDLLSDQRAQARYAAAMKVAWSEAGSSYPLVVLELLVAAPFDPANNDRYKRQEVWKRLSKHACRDFQDDYVAWVEALPEGEDRRMAVVALVQEVSTVDPDLADSIRTRELKKEERR
ncbi:MAG: hypothetical protein QM755_11205 [Luteolibacter sp.]